MQIKYLTKALIAALITLQSSASFQSNNSNLNNFLNKKPQSPLFSPSSSIIKPPKKLLYYTSPTLDGINDIDPGLFNIYLNTVKGLPLQLAQGYDVTFDNDFFIAHIKAHPRTSNSLATIKESSQTRIAQLQLAVLLAKHLVLNTQSEVFNGRIELGGEIENPSIFELKVLQIFSRRSPEGGLEEVTHPLPRPYNNKPQLGWPTSTSNEKDPEFPAANYDSAILKKLHELLEKDYAANAPLFTLKITPHYEASEEYLLIEKKVADQALPNEEITEFLKHCALLYAAGFITDDFTNPTSPFYKKDSKQLVENASWILENNGSIIIRPKGAQLLKFDYSVDEDGDLFIDEL